MTPHKYCKQRSHAPVPSQNGLAPTVGGMHTHMHSHRGVRGVPVVLPPICSEIMYSWHCTNPIPPIYQGAACTKNCCSLPNASSNGESHLKTRIGSRAPPRDLLCLADMREEPSTATTKRQRISIQIQQYSLCQR